MKIEIFKRGIISIIKDKGDTITEYVFFIKGTGKRWIKYQNRTISDQKEQDYNVCQQLIHDFNFDLNQKYGTKEWKDLQGVEYAKHLTRNFESLLKDENDLDDIYFEIINGVKMLKGVTVSDMITEK